MDILFECRINHHASPVLS